MKRLWIILWHFFVLSWMACAGSTSDSIPQGIEVANPMPIPKKQILFFQTIYTIDVPAHWNFYDLSNQKAPPTVLVDPVLNSDVVTGAHFERKNQEGQSAQAITGYVTFFGYQLGSAETLDGFMEARGHKAETTTVMDDQLVAEGQGRIVLYFVSEPFADGGSEAFYFMSTENVVLWVRMQLLGTPEEQVNTINEFFDITETLQILDS
jgi:hypothetical protein